LRQNGITLIKEYLIIDLFVLHIKEINDFL